MMIMIDDHDQVLKLMILILVLKTSQFVKIFSKARPRYLRSAASLFWWDYDDDDDDDDDSDDEWVVQK